MPDRSIVLRIKAEIGDAKRKLDSLRKSVDDTTTSTDKQKQSTKAASADLDRLGNAATVAGLAISAGIGFGIKSFADFDEAMSGVAAALPKAGAQMDRLRKLAIDLGKDTQFSATEAAEGITELAKAGVEAGDIMGGGLKGALDLAAAGQMGVAEAAETAATAMTQFKLSGEDVPHIADLLAAGAGKAQGSVRDLGMALKQSGLVASQTGLTIEETTGGLAAFASAGLIGSDAGTSFKTMLQRLTPQGRKAQEQFEALGISAYDANGQFVGLADFAGQLQGAMQRLTPEARNAALAVLFGSDAVRAAAVLYEQGADGIQGWIDKVNDAGFAAEQAAKLTDNWKGDLERLGGAIDSVFVQNGSGLNDLLRNLTQSVEGAVEWFGRLPGPVQQGTLGFIGLSGAGLLALGAFAKIVTTGRDLSDALTSIRSSGGRAARGLDVMTTAAKKLAVVMVGLATASAAADAWTDKMSVPVQQLTRDMLDASDAADVVNLAFERTSVLGGRVDSDIKSLGDALSVTFDPSTGDRIESVIDGIWGAFGRDQVGNMAIAAERLGSIDQALANLVTGGHADRAAEIFADLSVEAEKSGHTTEQLQQALPGYTEALAAATTQQQLGADSASDMATELDNIDDSAEEAKVSIEDLAEEIRGFGSTAMSADKAEADFQAAIDEATESIKENGKAVKNHGTELDLNREAGRKNQAQLLSLATETKNSAAATFELSGSYEDAAAKIATGRAEFIKAATQAGLTKTAAEGLADAYGLIPDDVSTLIHTAGDKVAMEKVDDFIARIKAIPQSKESRIAAKVSGIGTLEYMLDLTRQMTSRTIRYTVAGSGRGGQLINADGGMHERRAGSLVRAFADGGFDGSVGAAQPQVRAYSGPRGILWSEEGSGPWEAFISGHPAKQPRSRTITEDVASRLGGMVVWARPFADGGIRSSAAAPAPIVIRQDGASQHTESYSQPRVEITVNNQYPQEEPTSVTVRRAMDHASALGMLG